MESIYTNPWIEAGVRVIYKRAIKAAGFVVNYDTQTVHLVLMVKQFCQAELMAEADRWDMVACAKPGLGAGLGDLMVRQARAALEILRMV